MIDWIDEKLKAWGRAKWRILNRSDGYPESIFGRIMEYGPGAGDHTRLEYFREGMTGDALEASLAIFQAIHNQRMTDRQYEVIFAHYAVRGMTAAQKADLLGFDRRASYYECIDRAQNSLAHYMDCSDSVRG